MRRVLVGAFVWSYFTIFREKSSGDCAEFLSAGNNDTGSCGLVKDLTFVGFNGKINRFVTDNFQLWKLPVINRKLNKYFISSRATHNS